MSKGTLVLLSAQQPSLQSSAGAGPASICPTPAPSAPAREEEEALCEAATRAEPSGASALREGRQAGEQGVDEKPLMARGPPL